MDNNLERSCSGKEGFGTFSAANTSVKKGLGTDSLLMSSQLGWL